MKRKRVAISRKRKSLISLAKLHGTDKWGAHWYAQNYEHHFAPLRLSKVKVLEIGIGGYEDPAAGGESLRMWRDFFPHAIIYGLDIHDKQCHSEKRIKVYQGHQSDYRVLGQIVKDADGIDIVIDDGSHINNDVAESFLTLFPLLNDKGIYVIEDLQTSYWEPFGGGDANRENTTMCKLKNLVDGLNHNEFDSPGYLPSYFDLHITSIHFYHNMAFIYKGSNNEGSNIVENNIFPGSKEAVTSPTLTRDLVPCSECGGNGIGADRVDGPSDVYQDQCNRCSGSGVEAEKAT